MPGESIEAEIKAVRLSLGLSQVEFAQLLGVTNVSVNRWENGRTVPSARTVERIRRARFAGVESAAGSVETSPASFQVRAGHMLGRESDLAQLETITLPGTITTLLGPAGIGKTTLARSFAARRSAAGQEVTWVDLSPLELGSSVLSTVIRALNLQIKGREDAGSVLREALGARACLLVLDTCEHVIHSVHDLLHDLDGATSRSAVLLTSRQITGLPSEQIVPLGPLDSAAGITLFQSLATGLSNQDQTLLPDLCARLDNIPLALELAAARTAILTVPQILERMDRQFDLIEPMVAAIRWSCELLSPSEGALFRALGVFQGPFDLPAIEAVSPGKDLLPTLERLVNQSMVLRDRVDGQIRYRLLDSLAAYARAWLIEAGEDVSVRSRHAHYMCEQTISAADRFRSREQIEALDGVDFLWPNLFPALSWTIEHGQSHDACAFATAMGRYSRRRALFIDGLTALDAALLVAPDDSVCTPAARIERALVLVAAGRLTDADRDIQHALALVTPGSIDHARAEDARGLIARGRSDPHTAAVAHEQSVALFLANGDSAGAASARLNLALIANISGDLESAMHGCHEAWTFIHGTGDIWGEATILANLGEIAARQQKPAEAIGYFEQAMERYRQFHDPEREAVIAANTGELQLTLGEFDRAERTITAASQHFRATGNRIQLANVLYLDGAVHAAFGRLPQSLESFRESLNLFWQLDDLMDIAYVLEVIARLHLEGGDLSLALRLWGGMEALRERERVPDYPLLDYNATLAMMTAEMGNPDLAAAFSEGYRLPVRTIVGEALHRGTVCEGPPLLIVKLISAEPKPKLNRYVPTERQTDILRLVAGGHTNTEIALKLNISPRTVERHLSTIFGHLGVDRRSAAVAVATARGFI